MNEPRRLYRSADDRMIAGVAAGLADYMNVDPVLVRVLWLISIPLTGFLTAFAYLVMMIVVPISGPEWPASAGFTPGAAGAPFAPPPPTQPGQPPQPGQPAPQAAPQASQSAPPAGPSYAWDTRWHSHGDRDRGIGGLALGALLIVVGGLFVWHEVDSRVNLGLIWPLAVVAVGVVLVLSSVGFRRSE